MVLTLISPPNPFDEFVDSSIKINNAPIRGNWETMSFFWAGSLLIFPQIREGDPCAYLIPAHVPDRVSVDENISTTVKEVDRLRREAQKIADEIRSSGDLGARAAAGAAAAQADLPGGSIDTWFDSMVALHNPWDYKWWDPEGAAKGTSIYENFGNFNFGATGAAAGYRLSVLQHMAGFVQGEGSTGVKSATKVQARLGLGGRYPYGDQLKDAKQIEHGFAYFNCRKANPR
jgi:hypothetical protein